ncbi:MAG TPA: D-alanyl-D-alanine carboxypeptidase/D-alanyl-D-alanine-endopeptidase [Candidatus Acidoferrales bacterium]|nr:D-alanyl-D-alanine carboxypeptidase/D-alanyl-D-alanine-endopeptidase [Candidatus Acidoferrales bacterium]
MRISAAKPLMRSAPFAAAALILLKALALGAEPGPRPQASPGDTLQARIDKILARPEFAHTSFGIEFYSLDANRVVYEHDGQKLFTPASTTKLLTEGTALAVLGADYRFHTRIYRTGPIEKNGTLKGDIVLVGSGDPNLSGRIQPDGSLDYADEDHSYGGTADHAKLIGDPLMVVRELADQIVAKGIKKITGHVIVDATLFAEGEPEGGTGAIISPIVINDNCIDLTLTPGPSAGTPVAMTVSPDTRYAKFLNGMKTSASTNSHVDMVSDVASPDGTRAVALGGEAKVGDKAGVVSYKIPVPSRFAEFVLADALKAKGIAAEPRPADAKPDFKALAAYYSDANAVAEHVSPPLSEDVKITLKVSQNLHASMMPLLIGSLKGAPPKNQQAGFDLERDFLTKAGLDLTGASQSDGAGGATAAFYTPDFMCHYLAYMSKRPDFKQFYAGLPILGKDGTLWNVQNDSPAAGQVHAKTGTFGAYNALRKMLMITGKGLAGYLDTKSGDHLAFAVYLNHVDVPLRDPDATTRIAGQAVGEIAAAAYDAPPAAVHTAGTDGEGAQPAPPHKSDMASEPSPQQVEPAARDYDVIIHNGHILDGSGNTWFAADLAIKGNRIAAIGKIPKEAKAAQTIDAKGLIVAPGFIDMLGQSEMSLLIDNRSVSKLSQGITSEITGEGGSIAPQNPRTLQPLQPFLDHFHLTVDWQDLDGYFKRLERDGTPINLGTYVGAAQVREAVIGDADRAPTALELDEMKQLVAAAMQQGALGLSTALIYPPGHYAKTPELIALAKVAAQSGGIYASHMRSEGRTEMAAIDEAIKIGRDAGLPVEIFHLKIAGQDRWHQMPSVVRKIEAARAAGVDIAADMYPYLAGATALASALPPWVADGGREKELARLHDPAARRRIKTEMAVSHADWENLYLASGGPGGVMIASVFNESLKKYEGKTVAEMAAAMHKSPVDGLMDFVIADNLQTGALYFIASEPDLQYGLKQTWTSIGLDAGEESLDGPLFGPHDHPRTWGSMPRFLGHYSRDLKLVPLEEAVRKITSLPAQRVHLQERGLLKPGFFADVTIFDPAKIIDRSTYEKPAQLASGVEYVFVNGKLAYTKGKLTGVKAGVALRGPGWQH